MVYANTYELFKKSIQDGDIIFLRDCTTCVSKIIQWFTVSPYSHVAIAFWETIGDDRRLMLVEAQGGSTRRILNASYYSNCDMDALVSPRPWSEIKQAALANVGVLKYSYTDAILVGVKDMLKKRLGLGSGEIADSNKDDEICSQFVAEVLRCSDRIITPAELFHRLANAGCPMRAVLRHER